MSEPQWRVSVPIACDTSRHASRLLPMTVSVIMPVKNAAAYIREAIESVYAQGSDVHELIIVDDGSTDDTIPIVCALKDDRTRVLSNESSGVSAARNMGARVACGQWLMFLDADDRLRPSAIQTLITATQATPDAIVIYGDYDLIDNEGRSIGRRRWLKNRSKPAGNVLEQLATGNFIVNGGIMIIRPHAFAASGGFDTSLKYCEDWHCWCRLAAVGEFQFIPGILLDYRLHATNTMNAAFRSPIDFLPAVDRVFNDPLILSKLPPSAISRMRRKAEAHLLTYSATQAVRFRRYRDALSYVWTIGRRSFTSTPRAVMKLSLAYLGI